MLGQTICCLHFMWVLKCPAPVMGIFPFLLWKTQIRKKKSLPSFHLKQQEFTKMMLRENEKMSSLMPNRDVRRGACHEGCCQKRESLNTGIISFQWKLQEVFPQQGRNRKIWSSNFYLKPWGQCSSSLKLINRKQSLVESRAFYH